MYLLRLTVHFVPMMVLSSATGLFWSAPVRVAGMADFLVGDKTR